jgi:xanthine dehydrogenase accessory factor
MNAWLPALSALHAAGTPCVLVTVAGTQGSAPRGPGARMVYSADAQFDTIGGGHLEWRAEQIARAVLADADTATARVERIALGPSLGQCCGGVVWLAFERMAHAASMLRQLEHCRDNDIDVWRAVPLDAAGAAVLYDVDGEACDLSAPDNGLAPTLFRNARQTHLARGSDGRRWLLDLCRAHQPQVVLFGAGHVGSALVALLRTLPCRVLWVDEREHMFPPDLPPQISIEATDTPNAVVDMAEPGAYFIVMTHSHALDQQLAERILRRKDLGWFGLIGSYTKRKQFLPDRHSRDLRQGARQHCRRGRRATGPIVGTASSAQRQAGRAPSIAGAPDRRFPLAPSVFRFYFLKAIH